MSRGRFLDRAAERRFAGLDARDRAWAMEAAYGTVRLRGRLDALLDRYVGGRPLDPVVRDVLRLGAYQLTEMAGVPDYAAVSESVELARAAGRARAAGLVNAVLKRVAADAAPGPATPGADLATPGADRGAPATAGPPADGSAEALAAWGSHPAWLVERWLARFGPSETAVLLAANNRRPELYIRLFGVAARDAIARLAAVGIPAEAAALDPRSLRLGRGAAPAEALAAVPAIVQDPAASAVARYAGVPAGAAVADLCAAPGGKSVALLDLGAGAVFAFDRSGRRLAAVRATADRLGIAGAGRSRGAAAGRGRLHLGVADATAVAVRPCSVVLLDAPCTGTGTFRRHPDGRWRVGPEDLASLARLQARILRAAAGAVAPGGLLVYATCSLEPEENEEQVEHFLADHADFRIDPPEGGGSAWAGEPVLRILPHAHGVDGAFAARLRRSR